MGLSFRVMKFEIIEKSSERWTEIVKKSSIYDFHHTRYFHQIDTDYDCKLLYFSDGNSFIAMPVVIRPIENTSYYDITSVYGYAGPVSYFEDDDKKKNLINFFTIEFTKWCNDNNIVSAFARLHPLIEQKEILEGVGEVVNLNKTVSIDLNLTPAEQWRVYRKSLKPDINKLRREGMTVKEAANEDEIDKFIDIYYETMDRVNASKMYYFSREYFHSFVSNSDFDAKILLAVVDNEIVAGAIFTFTEKIIQYHLAGTTDDYIRVAPMKLILDEARLIGNNTSASDLHLGGGVNGSDSDSLFNFKSGFSKNFKQFSIWKYIINEKVYNELSEGKEQSNFFPLYRS